MKLLLIYLTSVVASYFLAFPIREALRRIGCIDVPNARSSHQNPVVRGGGVAPLLVITAAMLVDYSGSALMLKVAALSSLFIAVISFADDLKSVGIGWRLATHSLAAGLAISFLWKRHEETSIGLSSWMIGYLVIVGYINSFNFMDGINGIAALQAIITGGGTALLGIRAGLAPSDGAVMLPLIISAAMLGFLPHNFPRARVFLGDVGSASIGFLLAFSGVWGASKVGGAFLIWICLLHANFIADTLITLIRRALAGEKWYAPHREHFYQRLVRSGMSHTRVSLAEAILQIVSLIVLWAAWGGGAVVLVGGAALVVVIWLLFFAYAEWKFQDCPAVAK